MSAQVNIVPIRQIYIVLADGNFHFLGESKAGFSPFSFPHLPGLTPSTSRQGGGPVCAEGGHDQREIWEKKAGFGEQPEEPGRDAGDEAAAGQAGGTKGQKMRSGSQTRIPHPCHSAGLIPVPGNGGKFCHNLSVERPALPEHPSRERLSAPAQTMERDSDSGGLIWPPERCVTDRSHPHGAHCRRWFQHPRPAPEETRRDRQEERVVPLIPRHRPAFPGHHSPPKAFPAPGSAFGPSPSVRVLSWRRSRRPGCGKPGEQLLQPGSGTGSGRKMRCGDSRGMQPIPILGKGPRSGTSGTRLAAATLAGPFL